MFRIQTSSKLCVCFSKVFTSFRHPIKGGCFGRVPRPRQGDRHRLREITAGQYSCLVLDTGSCKLDRPTIQCWEGTMYTIVGLRNCLRTERNRDCRSSSNCWKSGMMDMLALIGRGNNLLSSHTKHWFDRNSHRIGFLANRYSSWPRDQCMHLLQILDSSW